MLPNHAVRTLMSTLQQCLARRDLNASCGIIRRILSETPPSSDVRSPLCHSAVTQVMEESVAALTQPSDGVTSSTSGVQLRSASMQVLASAAQRTGRWRDALLFAHHMERVPSPHFISTLVGPGNWKAVDHFRRTHGWSWNVPMAMERLFVNYGLWHEALQLAIAAERDPFCATTSRSGANGPKDYHSERYSLAVIVPLIAKQREGWCHALSLFNAAIRGGYLQDEALCASILNGCVRGGHWALGLRIFNSLARIQALEGIVTREAAFGRDIVDDIVRVAPQWTTALAVLQCARRFATTSPSRSLLERVVTRCDEAGQWEAATCVYETAVRDGIVDRLLPNDHHASHTHTDTAYNRIVRSFIRMSQWQKAVEAVSWMSHAGEAAMAAGMTDLLELCESSGQWAVSLQLGRRLLQSPTSTSGTIGSSTYLSLLFACSTGKQWTQAIFLYDRMLRDQSCDVHPLAACSVLQACSAANAWAEGLSFFETRVRSQVPRVIVPPLAITLATKLCVRHVRWNEALFLLDLMVQEGLPMDNHGQKLGMWAAALSGSWLRSLRHFSQLPKHQRSVSDNVVVRSSTRFAGPLATAVVMRHLHLAGARSDTRR